MAINDGGQAFPGLETPAGGVPGMSLRDHFAAQAMELGWREECDRPTGEYSEHMSPTYKGAATRAYHYADAMLAARDAEAREK